MLNVHTGEETTGKKTVWSESPDAQKSHTDLKQQYLHSKHAWARAPTSDGVCTNSFSLAATVKNLAQ